MNRVGSRDEALPNHALVSRWPHHGASLFARERLLERFEVGERSDDPILGHRMRIALDHHALCLQPSRVAAELAPGDEELLVRREPIDGRSRRLALL